MKSDHITDQTTRTNTYRFNRYKYFYIYYAHSIALYNSECEKQDLVFLQSINTVLNPRDLNQNGMPVFINFTLYAKQVWYRGYTAGVCLEVIVALLKHIPVFSLYTRLPISIKEQTRIIDTYNKTGLVESDIAMLSGIFSKSFVNRFCDFIEGDLP